MKVQIIQAQAESEALEKSNNARAEVLSNTIRSYSKSYTEVKGIIGTTSNKELLDYIFYINIMNLD